MHSDGYAVPGRYCRSRMHYRVLTWLPIPTRSPLELSLIPTKRPSKVARFASNKSGFMPMETRGGFRRFATVPSLPACRSQRGPKVLPGGCHVEAREAREHRPLPGCHYRPLTAHFGLDVGGESVGIYREEAWRRPTRPCTFPSCCVK